MDPLAIGISKYENDLKKRKSSSKPSFLIVLILHVRCLIKDHEHVIGCMKYAQDCVWVCSCKCGCILVHPGKLNSDKCYIYEMNTYMFENVNGGNVALISHYRNEIICNSMWLIYLLYLFFARESWSKMKILLPSKDEHQ